MIAKEIRFRLEHYVLLIILLSGFVASFLLATTEVLRIVLAVALGISYLLWGVWSHRRELLTVRLVLEYFSVAILGCGMLIILTRAL